MAKKIGELETTKGLSNGALPIRLVPPESLSQIEGGVVLAQVKGDAVLVNRNAIEELHKKAHERFPNDARAAQRDVVSVSTSLIAHELQHGVDRAELAARTGSQLPFAGLREGELSADLTGALAALELTDRTRSGRSHAAAALALGEKNDLFATHSSTVLGAALLPTSQEAVAALMDVNAGVKRISLGENYSEYHAKAQSIVLQNQAALQDIATERQEFSRHMMVGKGFQAFFSLLSYLPTSPGQSFRDETALGVENDRRRIEKLDQRTESLTETNALVNGLDDPATYAVVKDYFDGRVRTFEQQHKALRQRLGLPSTK